MISPYPVIRVTPPFRFGRTIFRRANGWSNLENNLLLKITITASAFIFTFLFANLCVLIVGATKKLQPIIP